MPLYEYKCEDCGETFEALQRFSDEPLKTHKKCGGRVVRVLSAPAFHFKGTGWYVTDYARAGGSNGKSSETKSPETKSSETPKAESKPAGAKSPTSSDASASKS